MGRQRRSGHIVLVLEGDASLRRRAVDMLEQGGFEVIEADNAATTLSYLEARGDDVAAIFTELNLFSPTGLPSLIRSIHDRWPHIRYFRRNVDPRDNVIVSKHNHR